MNRVFWPEAAERARTRRALRKLKARDIAFYQGEDHTNEGNRGNSEHPPALGAIDWSEQPAPLVKCFLGSAMMLSPALFDDRAQISLDTATEMALLQICRRTGLQDGDALLDWGCGWGALTFYIMQYYPNCTITAVSDSWTQCDYVERECLSRNIPRVKVIQANLSEWTPPASAFNCFFAVSSPLKNLTVSHRQIMDSAERSLKPRGRLFIQLPAHRQGGFKLSPSLPVIGGLNVPAVETLLFYQSRMIIEERWLTNGRHAAQTIESWLAGLRSNITLATAMLHELFPAAEVSAQLDQIQIMLACAAECFGFDDGNEWLFAQYLCKKR